MDGVRKKHEMKERSSTLPLIIRAAGRTHPRLFTTRKGVTRPYVLPRSSMRAPPLTCPPLRRVLRVHVYCPAPPPALPGGSREALEANSTTGG